MQIKTLFTFASLFLVLLFIQMHAYAIESYEVLFQGEIPAPVHSLLCSSSELLALQKTPPATPAGLRHRAEADIQNFIKILHSQAYFNAIIDLKYNFEQHPAVVIVNVNPGPIYPLASFSIVSADQSPYPTYPYDKINLCDIGIQLEQPARPKSILEAEEELLHLLARKGYPLAEIVKREVLADQHLHAVFATLYVNSGPLAFFGQTTITGNCKVKEEFIQKKIAWAIGDSYNTRKIERTQAAIEASGLFTSITISHANSLTLDHQLPMTIEVVEAKHRSIGWGVTYDTYRGPGVSVEWEHRNIGGMGEKLSFDGDFWFDTQELRLLYVKPDFLRPGQDFLWIADAEHQSTKGFHETSFSLSGLVERQLNRNLRISYGGTYKILQDTHADLDGSYNLLKAPLFLRLNRVDNLLDPTKGSSINLRVIPSWQFLRPQFLYCINTLTGTTYYPLSEDRRYVFAAKAMFGSILGSNRRSIPSSERFYEGTDSAMRGYRYLTVSPLDRHHKPTGGRSLLIGSCELRVRATESFGWVAFYEIGNVYANVFPELNHKVLQSIGYGIRYHTPVGPLRLDVAIPLNPRKHVDGRYEVYLSIGQAF
jgi:translocation and assembly module TamA